MLRHFPLIIIKLQIYKPPYCVNHKCFFYTHGTLKRSLVESVNTQFDGDGSMQWYVDTDVEMGDFCYILILRIQYSKYIIIVKRT